MLQVKEANICLRYIEKIGDLGCLSTDMEDVHHENMQMNHKIPACRDFVGIEKLSLSLCGSASISIHDDINSRSWNCEKPLP